VKLHDLKPAPGSRQAKRRVGRGIAAGQGKTAGRGTKGQKARAGGSIPAWFEGGQTPLHRRLPKLRGFRNPFKIQYEVVNLGDIARLVELGELDGGEMPGSKGSKKGTPAPITVNQEILRAAGLVRRLDRPLKVLGGGELGAGLFVVADAFSASARSKIEAAGGTVSVLEVPEAKRPALRVEPDATATEPAAAEPEAEAAPAEAAPAKRLRARRAPAEAPDASESAAGDDAFAEVEAQAEAPAVEATADANAAEAPEATDEPAPAKTRAARKPRAQKPETDA
jgi:large subunit ribosomal protein L15